LGPRKSGYIRDFFRIRIESSIDALDLHKSRAKSGVSEIPQALFYSSIVPRGEGDFTGAEGGKQCKTRHFFAAVSRLEKRLIW
jgi:hypothetical protein